MPPSNSEGALSVGVDVVLPRPLGTGLTEASCRARTLTGLSMGDDGPWFDPTCVFSPKGNKETTSEVVALDGWSAVRTALESRSPWNVARSSRHTSGWLDVDERGAKVTACLAPAFAACRVTASGLFLSGAMGQQGHECVGG